MSYRKNTGNKLRDQKVKCKVLIEQRLTYLLRPNITRPDFHARATLDTPPVTDLDYTSQERKSDFISETPSIGVLISLLLMVLSQVLLPELLLPAALSFYMQPTLISAYVSATGATFNSMTGHRESTRRTSEKFGAWKKMDFNTELR
ncbi:hypothetical protein PILCRDRAFT_762809 [Piloderma croceum F 1598]|uniref:Uncharacterized protein n=1 Tax=Piloderma croceum (strain F 1598) TaxID=765440 RepID=A0A0C3GL93_PILCF|nr:hypothetical protein PILCRDRAFT_762809 [Piloderma croceum F 1598]